MQYLTTTRDSSNCESFPSELRLSSRLYNRETFPPQTICGVMYVMLQLKLSNRTYSKFTVILTFISDSGTDSNELFIDERYKFSYILLL